MKAQNRIKLILEADTEDFLELAKLSGLDPAHDFRGMNLRDVDFSGMDLSGFDFRGSEIDPSKFVGSDIRHTKFDSVQARTLGNQNNRADELISYNDFLILFDYRVFHANKSLQILLANALARTTTGYENKFDTKRLHKLLKNDKNFPDRRYVQSFLRNLRAARADAKKCSIVYYHLALYEKANPYRDKLDKEIFGMPFEHNFSKKFGGLPKKELVSKFYEYQTMATEGATPSERKRGIELLASLGSEDAFNFLEQFVWNSRHRAARKDAIKQISKSKKDKAIDWLKKFSEEHKDMTCRETAALEVLKIAGISEFYWLLFMIRLFDESEGSALAKSLYRILYEREKNQQKETSIGIDIEIMNTFNALTHEYSKVCLIAIYLHFFFDKREHEKVFEMALSLNQTNSKVSAFAMLLRYWPNFKEPRAEIELSIQNSKELWEKNQAKSILRELDSGRPMRLINKLFW